MTFALIFCAPFVAIGLAFATGNAWINHADHIRAARAGRG